MTSSEHSHVLSSLPKLQFASNGKEYKYRSLYRGERQGFCIRNRKFY